MLRWATAAASSMSIALSGCALVAGTSDYDFCEGDSCEDASTSSSTSGCFDVTIRVYGSVDVELNDDSNFDVEDGGEETFCLAPGPHKIAAFCDQSGGDDPPVAVSWGNRLCTDGTSSCTFTLRGDTRFDVRSSACP